MKIKEAVNSLIEDAINKHSSDIFFLMRGVNLVVRFRTIIGIEKEAEYSIKEGKEMINFLKFAAQMDIAEHRRPQVGAFEYDFKGQIYYLRLSSIGDFNDHESLVIRIIYQISTGKYFFDEQIENLKTLAQRRGLIVTSGPTGSGKTTTMYNLAKMIGQNQMVMTIEDPVEIHEISFLQTQVNMTAEITYSKLLEAALRHRPDILIIGEIRNAITARLAIDAALSGHLVFATVHAKSTLQTISRLESLNINTADLYNCLTAVSYQRLLPTNTGFACLMDIDSGHQLQADISKHKRCDYVNWHQNLVRLKERKRISEQVFEQFQAG
ncbi:competence type IV pilus ATPase ComGA [uncultured Lactobacillus sp.]|uniref:competence type IV pilus ATPase ComGA n=1 Tax=uncultured Lactobacillus sp. TaxID=153152 RepID=UPI0025F684E6|nr:competence type IV pilus ATPase ComGA [uncultured Lactobacillus sp.]